MAKLCVRTVISCKLLRPACTCSKLDIYYYVWVPVYTWTSIANAPVALQQHYTHP